MKIRICILLFFMPLFLIGQNQKLRLFDGKHLVYGEALGVTGWYSVNYERIIIQRKLSVSLATGYYQIGWKGHDITYFPARLMLFYPFRKAFYAEAGLDYLFGKREYSSFLGHSRVDREVLRFFHFGIRYQPPTRRVFGKIYFFPVPNITGYGSYVIDLGRTHQHGRRYYLWGGLSLGFRF